MKRSTSPLDSGLRGCKRRALTFRSTSVAAMSIAVFGCGSPTEPTNGVTPDFIVATGTNVIRVGESTRFTVTAYIRDSNPNAYVLGTQQSVDISAFANWSSDNSTVAGVSSRVIVGRTAGATNLRASYMGRDYAIPVYVVASNPAARQFAGMWSGVATEFCNDLIGNTRTCYDINGQPAMTTTGISLSLIDVDGVLAGSIDIGGGSFSHVTGAVVGGVDDRGELVIGGTPSLSEHTYVEQLKDWRLILSGSQLTGSGTSDVAFVNIYGPVLHRITYTSITLH